MKLFIIAMLGLVFHAGAQEFTSTETVTSPAEQDLSIGVSNINGDITVETWDSSEVQVTWTITCEEEEELDEVSVLSDTGDGLSFSVDFSDDMNDDHHGSIDFSIMVPSDVSMNYSLETVNGEIALAGGTGTASLSLVNGDVQASDFAGTVDVEAVNADIRTVNIGGLKSVEIVNGSVDIDSDELVDDLVVESVNADVSVGFNSALTLEMETLSGEISLPDQFSSAIEENLVGKTAGFGSGEYLLEISTVNGDISITD